MSKLSPEEEAQRKQAIFDRMSPRRQKHILKLGFDKWDPFQEPKDPIDIRQQLKATEGTQAAHGVGTNRSVDHFVDCVINRRKPLVDVRDGAKTTAALIAGTESALSGQPVRVFNTF